MKRKHEKKPQKKRSANGNKTTLTVIIGICIVLAVGYAAAGVYFSGHFYNGTVINGCDVSGLSSDEAKEKLKSSVDGYVLTLEEHNGYTETISGSDIDLTVSITDTFDALLKNQGGFAWASHLFGSREFTADENMINYTYDNVKLSEIVDSLDCISPEYPIEAKNASLILMDGEFQIVPEDVGNTAQRDKLEEKIKISIESQKDTINLTEEDIYDKPSVYSDDPEIVAKKDLCENLINIEIDLIFGYSDEHIDIQTILDWIGVTKQDDGEYTLTVDRDAVAEYVKTLSEKYNTFGKPKTFAATRGDVVEIIYGDYGWLLDSNYAIDKITELVLSGQSVTLDLSDHSEASNQWWTQTAVGYDANGNDYFGTTYAEVSISEQHMWMYQDGVLALETDVVTGNPNLGNDTPQGAFKIRYKELNATLRGPGYVTPVAYWMVFADDVGFHDATWQPNFGGDLYYSNGSHGCVNMPIDQAEKLYDLVYDGMPVLVYY